MQHCPNFYWSKNCKITLSCWFCGCFVFLLQFFGCFYVAAWFLLLFFVAILCCCFLLLFFVAVFCYYSLLLFFLLFFVAVFCYYSLLLFFLLFFVAVFLLLTCLSTRCCASRYWSSVRSVNSTESSSRVTASRSVWRIRARVISCSPGTDNLGIFCSSLMASYTKNYSKNRQLRIVCPKWIITLIRYK